MLATETELSVNLVNSTKCNVESKASITRNIVGRTLCILHLRMKNGWINDEWTNGLVDK